MKLEKNGRYFTIAVYVLLTAFAIALFTALCVNAVSVRNALSHLISIFKPLLYALLLALLLVPVERFFSVRVFSFVEKKKAHPKLRKILSMTATYLLVLLLLIGFVALVIPQVESSYEDLAEKGPRYLTTAQRFLENQLSSFEIFDTVVTIPQRPFAYNKEAVASLDDLRPCLSLSSQLQNPMMAALREVRSSGVSLNLSGMLTGLLDHSYVLLSQAAPILLGALSSLLTEVKNAFLGLIISIYLLASRPKLAAQFRKLLAALFPGKGKERMTRIGQIAYRTFTEFISGKLIDGLIMGMFCFFAMTILRLPYAPLISVGIGVSNLIPFVGPVVGAAVGALIVFLSDPLSALWFLIMILALQQLDMNYIEPKLVGDHSGMPTLLILTAVVVTGGFLGVIGLFIGVPLFAVLYALVSEWIENRLGKKGFPTEMDAYYERDIFHEPPGFSFSSEEKERK